MPDKQIKAAPQRIQLKRTKGFDLQAVSKTLNGLPVVKVARPTKFGNPFKVGYEIKYGVRIQTDIEAVDFYKFHLLVRLSNNSHYLDDLRGKNLACFCPVDAVCHADVLLEYANRGEQQ